MKKLLFTLLLIAPFMTCGAQTLADAGCSQSSVASDMAVFDFPEAVLLQRSDTALFGLVVTQGNTMSYHPFDFGFSFGTSMYMGEYDYKASFKDWWTFPALNFSATYWATHCVGVGADIYFRKYKGLGHGNDLDATFNHAAEKYGSTDFYQATGSYMGIIANGCLDVTRLFHWDVRRQYRLVMFAGAGAVIATKSANSSAGWTLQGGFRNHWRLNNHWDLDAILSGSLVSDKFDGEYAPVNEKNIPVDGTLAFLIGFTYKM